MKKILWIIPLLCCSCIPLNKNTKLILGFGIVTQNNVPNIASFHRVSSVGISWDSGVFVGYHKNIETDINTNTALLIDMENNVIKTQGD